MKHLFPITLLGLFILSGCASKQPVKTLENLKAGIKKETSASAKYQAFAERALFEGNIQIAKLFEAASKAEEIHTINHRKVLEDLGDTLIDFTPVFEMKTTMENLQGGIEEKEYDLSSLYPQFLEDAKDEKVPKAERSFKWARDTEKKHQAFFTNALDALNNGTMETLPAGYSICPVCGNTYDATKVAEKCALCQTGKEKFIAI